MELPTPQLLFDGAVTGLVIGLLATGIVLVYRSTRVINFAVANMGLVGSVLLALLVVRWHVPYWPALGVSLLSGALFGAVVDVVVVRRLFTAPRVILLVATIGVAQLALTIVTAYPDLDDYATETYPVPWAGTWQPLDGLQITGAQLAILLAVPLTALLLGWFLERTVLGRTVRAAADNPDLARLNGISPRTVSTAVWAAAGLLGTLCLVLVSGQNAALTQSATLGPPTLLRALAAAAIARLASFRIALLAGVGLGLLQSFIQFNWLDQPGLPDLAVLVIVLVAVFLVSRDGAAETGTFSFAPKVRPVPERLREVWWVRNIERFGLAALALVAVVVPLVVAQPSRHLLHTVILGYAICAASVTCLTGWAGQLSLGQMAFAGIGALTAATLNRGLRVDVGDTTYAFSALPFAAAVPVAALVTAALAALIGAGALRVRGLLLAVSTFAFAVACEQYVYRLDVFHDEGSSTASFPRSTVLGIDVSSERAYYYVALGVLVAVLAVVARLRRSGVGRTTIAVRDNPAAAAAYTVAGTPVKLRAFALSGGIAGIGGALLAGAVQSVPYNDRYFLSTDSLALVSIVVIGGLGSIAGPILGSLWVVGLPALMPDNDLVPLLSSGVGLLVLLLFLPSGLVQIGYTLRDALLARVDRNLPAAPAPERTLAASPLESARSVREPVPEGRPVLTTDGLSVAFGGLTAVDDVSIEVRPNEIVGLIGTNGAGKSTLMDAVGGFVAAEGGVHLLGRDVSGRSPASRARAGLGRTFQSAALFPELTVRETVEVALEARGRTGLLATAFHLPHTFARDRARRAEALDLIDFLGLGSHADSFVGDLSTGTRRIVEIAGLLALNARVLCLDEPAAGVAQRETEALGHLLQEVRRELGASILLIEHDMPLVMGVSDRLYCLETGQVIATGDPETVRNDPGVIASYLGTPAPERGGPATSGATVRA